MWDNWFQLFARDTFLIGFDRKISRDICLTTLHFTVFCVPNRKHWSAPQTTSYTNRIKKCLQTIYINRQRMNDDL